MKTKKEVAAEAFNGGFNCAQSVVAAFCDKYGVDRETALKMAGGMGGGFRSGEICGAVSGGTMVVGLKYGQYAEGDVSSKKNCGEKTKKFIKAFKETNSSVVCREILKLEDGAESGKHDRRVCAEMIKNAVEILEQQGY